MKKLTTVEIAELEATIQKLRSKANSLAKQLEEDDSESHLTLKEKMQIKAEIQGLRAEANKLKKQIENSEKELDETAEAAAKKAAEEAAAKKAAEEAAAKKVAEEAAAKKAAEEAAAKKAAEEAAAKKAAEEAAAKKADTDFLDDMLADYPYSLAAKKAAKEAAAKKKAAEEADDFASFDDADLVESFEEEETKVPKDKKSIWLAILGIAVVLCLITILVMVFIPNKESNQGLKDFESESVDENSIVINTSQDKIDFDISNFNAISVNLGKYSTDEEDIVGNVYKTTENIGTKKLAELTKKYGETNVASTIVNIIVGGSEAMRDAKVAKEGWQYNPNAAEEYYNTYMDICDAYEIKSGKNPTVVLESIAAYKANPGNRSAIEKEIRSTGDLDLLEWYQANAVASDLLNKQSRDTQLADQYKENVEDKLIESESFITILEKVLQKQKTGDFAVIENNEYSKEFKDYIAIEIATVVGAAK